MWRGVGVLLLAGGLYWLLPQGKGTQLSPSERAEAQAARVPLLFEQYVQEAGQFEADPEPTAEILREAARLLEEALTIQPLNANWHYMRGVLALYQPGELEMAERSFAIQRHLYPGRVADVLLQAEAARVADKYPLVLALWNEALQSKYQEGRGKRMGRDEIFARIMSQAGSDESLIRGTLDLAATDWALMRQWAERVPLPFLNTEMPWILNGPLAPEVRLDLGRVWQRRGNRTEFEAYAQDDPILATLLPARRRGP